MSGRRVPTGAGGPAPEASGGITAMGAAWLRCLGVREDGASGAEAVGALTLQPGRVSARIDGARGGVSRVVLRVDLLGLPAWRSMLDCLVRRPQLLAAVLDGELPEELIAAAGGPEMLVPAPVQVRASCTCGSRQRVCEHSVAAWRRLAQQIDARPASVLTVRGHAADLLGSVRRRARAVRLGGRSEAGVDPADAFARVTDALPSPLPLPDRPGTPRWLPERAPPPPAILPIEALVELAGDAARRAWDLATGAGDGGLGLDGDADLARRVAPLVDDQAALIALADRVGIDPWSLARLGLAWRAGGAGAVEVLQRTWSPMDERMAPIAAGLARIGPVERRANRITTGDVQLRLGRDRRWYGLGREGGEWVLREPPGDDPAEVLGRMGLPVAPGSLAAPAAMATGGRRGARSHREHSDRQLTLW